MWFLKRENPELVQNDATVVVITTTRASHIGTGQDERLCKTKKEGLYLDVIKVKILTAECEKYVNNLALSFSLPCFTHMGALTALWSALQLDCFPPFLLKSCKAFWCISATYCSGGRTTARIAHGKQLTRKASYVCRVPKGKK